MSFRAFPLVRTLLKWDIIQSFLAAGYPPRMLATLYTNGHFFQIEKYTYYVNNYIFSRLRTAYNRTPQGVLQGSEITLLETSTINLKI